MEQPNVPIYKVINKHVLSNFHSFISIPFDAVESGTYLYPFIVCICHLFTQLSTNVQGIKYFYTHSELWPFYLTIFIPQLILTLFVYLVVFIICFPIQFIVLTLIAGPFVFISTWISVIHQSIVISAFIVTFFMMPEIQRITFDAVLSKEFADDAILLARLRRIVKVPFWIKCGNFIIKIPQALTFPYVVVRAIILVLIGFIPFIGPCIVILLQAPSKGLQSHSRYFIIKGYTKPQIKSYYRENTGGYIGFGIVLLILELIPLLNVFFMFTNNLGAALWAVDLENVLAGRVPERNENILTIRVPDGIEKSLEGRVVPDKNEVSTHGWSSSVAHPKCAVARSTPTLGAPSDNTSNDLTSKSATVEVATS